MLQSFHLPSSLRSFFRFIRIDFLSNYGSEFYCPVSLLRVYGLTHLEDYKWDEWEEAKKKGREVPEARREEDCVVSGLVTERERQTDSCNLIGMLRVGIQ